MTELKNGLSSYISKVREGGQFIITEHDKPVAKLCPLSEEEASTVEERLVALIRTGKVQCSKPLQEFSPPQMIEIKGLSAAELLIRMRT